MGFFGNKKKEDKPSDLPPPVPSAESKPQSSEIPSPDQVIDSSQMPLEAPSTPVENSNLEMPPTPNMMDNNSSLGNIKEQVQETPSNNTQTQESPVQDKTQEESFSSSDFDDSLFNFSEMDLPSSVSDSVESKSTQEVSMQLDEKDDFSVPLAHDENQHLNFIEKGDSYNSVKSDEVFFVTTAQYKSLLDIVDRVKNRVKDSSDTHLRLLDIKSEEDIEYENLKKNFEFIEDKLYEVDSLIFEK